jgi:hypothetical protein
VEFQRLTVSEVSEIAEEVCAGHNGATPAVLGANPKQTDDDEYSTIPNQGNVSIFQQNPLIASFSMRFLNNGRIPFTGDPLLSREHTH